MVPGFRIWQYSASDVDTGMLSHKSFQAMGSEARDMRELCPRAAMDPSDKALVYE
jgi:hypothetical protein